MGRKKQRKNQMSKAEFVSEICVGKCYICSGTDIEPSFCFTQLYQKNPKLFMKRVLENFIDSWQDLVELQNEFYTSDEEMIDLFKKNVCDTNICKNCTATDFDVFLCLGRYMEQSESLFRNGTYSGFKDFEKKTSKPYIFTHKSAKFNEEIDKILENYNKQQTVGGGIISGY